MLARYAWRLVAGDKTEGTRPPVYKTGLPFIGPFLDFASNQNECVKKAYKKHGPVFTIPLVSMPCTFLVGTEAHAAFFAANDDQLDVGVCYEFMTPVFGKGVVYDAPLKKRQQQFKMLGACLRSAELRAYPAIIGREAKEFFETFKDKHSEDLLTTMSQLTIMTASSTLHGPEVRNNMFKDLSYLFAELDKGIVPLSYIWPYAPTKAHAARDKAHVGLINLFGGVVRDHREKMAQGIDMTTGRTDLLSKFVAARYKDGTLYPEQEVAGLLIAGLFGGQHTSSATLSFTLSFLIEDGKTNGGKWFKLIREELAQVERTPGAFKRGDVNDDDVASLVVLKAVIKETIRLRPPLGFVLRKVINEPLKACGYTIPIGHYVWLATAVAHQLPVFENATTWDPSRWLKKNIAHNKRNNYTFVGFGAGYHACMGESFAFLQIRTILAVLLSTFDLTMPGPMPIVDVESMVALPKGKNPVIYTRRGEGVGAEDVGQINTVPSTANGIANDNATEDANEEEAASQYFTREEVATHNKSDDLWIIVEGKVYDMSKFYPSHQGGTSMLKFAGKEATKAVYGPQHPDLVRNMLPEFYVGDIEGE